MPSDAVYSASTMSGNLPAMVAGLATLDVFTAGRVWKEVAALTEVFAVGIRERASAAGVTVSQHTAGTMFSTFFLDRPPMSWSDISSTDTGRFATFFRAMREQEVFLPPSQFEACFVSAAHGAQEQRSTLQAARSSLLPKLRGGMPRE